MPNKRDPTPRTTRARLRERIELLMEEVQDLRSYNEQLETERNQLQQENQALRRELTESRLLNHLKQPNASEDAPPVQNLPPLAEQLYQALPESFSFPVYFQVAEDEDLEMETARRCLRHFLLEKRLAREGSRLRKKEESLIEKNGDKNEQSSRLPA